ncbi:response regulator [Coralloluteibacterium stylophorae]|uniref:histidine kinase n=1 Tax=Coralloluteibacterium stylophorae TaxID=1776034 RepID=A0A8J7VVJ5_9GAMM|nr:response regulator [Coralloluteibacterium stylophorae]MBS7457484.1 response regulator [Coralloluteibacterium stylophorae]
MADLPASDDVMAQARSRDGHGDAPPLPTDAPALDFRLFLDAAPAPYVVLSADPAFRIVWANHAYLAATGRRLEAIAGRSMFEAFPGTPDEIGRRSEDELRASLSRVLASGESDALALIHYRIARDADAGDFVDRYWSATHTPIHDRLGRLAYILQVTEDVTDLQQLDAQQADAHQRRRGDAMFRRAEQVQAHARLLRSEGEKLRQLFEQAPAFVAILSGPEHVFDLANRAYRELIGDRDLLGHRVRDALPEALEQGFVGILDRVYATGEAYAAKGAELVLQAAGQEPHVVIIDFIYHPMVDAGGRTTGVFVVGNDITGHTRAQQELQHHRDRLEDLVLARTRALEESEAERRQAEAALRHAQKMEAIGQLTGGVAHDFNNLLQVIGGNLQLLQRNVHGDQDTRRLRTAIDAVERGAKVAAQLLAFARRQPLEPRAVNLGRLVRGMDDLLRRALGEAVELETVIGGGLWTTLADPDQVENAILNLAVNARDAMNGSGRLTIEAGNAMLDATYSLEHGDLEPGQYVMLAVSDTGTGMDEATLERVFEPFFSTKPEGRGTGPGLSMVYGFVKQSGGHIKIYSERGHGTTVKIYLPRSLLAEEVRPTVDTGPVEGGTETVLVVEDDPQVQATVVDMLKGLGYRVLRASDAQSALAIAESGVPIDLLFTDVVMPGPIRSPELARRVRELLPEAAVLFTSGYTENAIVHGGRLDPGVQLLSKPYRREDLARRVRRVLRQRSGADAPPAPPQSPAAPRTPQSFDSVTAETGSAMTDPTQSADPDAAPARILFVEDNAMIQMTTAEMLEAMGHHVSAHGDAESALQAMAADSFDVLFTDIELPGMNGVELARRALAEHPGLAVILASGYGESSGELPPGNVRHLPKPYGIDDIERLFGSVAS